MLSRNNILTVVALSTSAALMIATSAPAGAEVLRGKVAFNDGIVKKTANQPTGGIELTFQFTLKGGELDGCTVDATERKFPREGGAWGTFYIAGKVACPGGDGFAYNTAGAWDGKGYHAGGAIIDGSGTGRFKGAQGPVAQIGGSANPAANGTADVAYELVVDTGRGP